MLAKRKSDGKIIEVREWRGASDAIYSSPDMNQFYQASDIEPYTEPTEKNPKETANTFASEEPTATESDDFNRIVKDGFRSHNRLHIAAMAMQGILSNPSLVKASIETYKAQVGNNDLYKCVAKAAFDQADALIAEAELTDKLKGE